MPGASIDAPKPGKGPPRSAVGEAIPTRCPAENDSVVCVNLTSPYRFDSASLVGWQQLVQAGCAVAVPVGVQTSTVGVQVRTMHDMRHHIAGPEHDAQDAFSTDITGLPGSVPTPTVQLSDGEVFDLRVAPVTKHIGDATVRMLAYNGSIPGPTLRVRQGSELVVNAANEGDLETTVHWHGLRLDNRFDGTHHTQKPIEVGATFQYRISFPDPGVYWYHPHIRQDYGQEMGLYGSIVVEPADPDYWPAFTPAESPPVVDERTKLVFLPLWLTDASPVVSVRRFSRRDRPSRSPVGDPPGYAAPRADRLPPVRRQPPTPVRWPLPSPRRGDCRRTPPGWWPRRCRCGREPAPCQSCG